MSVKLDPPMSWGQIVGEHFAGANWKYREAGMNLIMWSLLRFTVR